MMLLNSRFFPWSPAMLTLDGWYDATDSSTITHSAGAVSQWRNKRGTMSHFDQSTGSRQPITGTRNINGLNVLDFDGTDDGFTLTSKNMISAEVYSVCRFDPSSSIGHIFGGGGNIQIGLDGATVRMRTWAGTNPYTADSRSTALSPSTNYILGWLCHNTTKKWSINGTLTTTTDTYISPRTLNATSVGRGQFTPYWNGVMGEIIVVNQNNSDRLRIEGYLAWKWGLVSNLPISHPYKNMRP